MTERLAASGYDQDFANGQLRSQTPACSYSAPMKPNKPTAERVIHTARRIALRRI